MTGCTRHIPRQSSHRIPRASRRGLGLLDALLAVVVMGVITVAGWQAADEWIDRKLLAGEGRALATLALAGRLWVEADTGTRTPALNTLEPVGFNDLVVANLRGRGDPTRTPARRDMTLWLWREANDRVLVLARARPRDPGDAARVSRFTPDAIDGVPGLGLVVNRAGVLTLAGPDVTLDLAPLNSGDPGFARAGDLFALIHVFASGDCGPYLYRDAVDCDGDGTDDPQANTMETDLDMGGQALIGLPDLTGISLTVETLIGAVTVPDTLTVEGDLVVEGEVATRDLAADSVQAETVFANTGDFTRITVDTLTVEDCEGCDQ